MNKNIFNKIFEYYVQNRIRENNDGIYAVYHHMYDSNFDAEMYFFYATSYEKAIEKVEKIKRKTGFFGAFFFEAARLSSKLESNSHEIISKYFSETEISSICRDEQIYDQRICEMLDKEIELKESFDKHMEWYVSFSKLPHMPELEPKHEIEITENFVQKRFHENMDQIYAYVADDQLRIKFIRGLSYEDAKKRRISVDIEDMDVIESFVAAKDFYEIVTPLLGIFDGALWKTTDEEAKKMLSENEDLNKLFVEWVDEHMNMMVKLT